MITFILGAAIVFILYAVGFLIPFLFPFVIAACFANGLDVVGWGMLLYSCHWLAKNREHLL